MSTTIGIIGNGIVGSAIQAGFYQTVKCRVYDKDPLKSINSLEEVCIDSEFIFLCLPTPMKKDGSADTSIVEEVIQRCLDYIKNTDTILIIKSTVPPGFTKKMQDRYRDYNLHIVFNPEFLTARNARLDFINTSRIILGGYIEDTKRLEDLYRKRFPHTPIIHTRPITAEMVKYMSNNFLSVKVAYCNEIYQICDKLGVDYNKVKNLTLMDGRIGNSHTDVPGFDGDFGFGGMCFPKDICALMDTAKKLGIKPSVMNGAWKKNLEVRKKRDWL